MGTLAKIAMTVTLDAEYRKALADISTAECRSLSGVANDAVGYWLAHRNDTLPTLAKAANA